MLLNRSECERTILMNVSRLATYFDSRKWTWVNVWVQIHVIKLSKDEEELSSSLRKYFRHLPITSKIADLIATIATHKTQVWKKNRKCFNISTSILIFSIVIFSWFYVAFSLIFVRLLCIVYITLYIFIIFSILYY